VFGEKMDLRPWKVTLLEGWDAQYKKFDTETKRRISKKVDQMENPLRGRGLCSSKLCVEEVGQYRIAFCVNEETRTKEIHFVGNHKQYEKWYKAQD
jgi:mRNA-degrading endonuclease RelE of RelBE toxin-antitoxin system